jgi:methionyl-tRNA synthetase
LGNLINRTLAFVSRYYEGKIPQVEGNGEFWGNVKKYEESIADKFEKAELREAFREIFELSSFANKTFQDGEPWRTRKDDPSSAEILIRDLSHVVWDIGIMIEPFMPSASHKIAEFFGETTEKSAWNTLSDVKKLEKIVKSEVLFLKLEDEQIESLRLRYSGTQEERKTEKKVEEQKTSAGKSEKQEKNFENSIDLRVAEIVKIERHPSADKLYVINLEIAGEERTIVSGLVGHYTEEDLFHKRIIVAYNLKPAKLRGIKSQGMLLAAGDKDENGKERVEVLFAENIATGTRVFLEEQTENSPPSAQIDIDTFFSIPILAKNHLVVSGDRALTLEGKKIFTKIIANAEVH